MTAQQLADRVQQEADARLPEVIERLFPLVRHQHTHAAYRGECYCSYCCFIRQQYIPLKLKIHLLKKKIYHLENTDDETSIRQARIINEMLLLKLQSLQKMKWKKKKMKAGEDFD